MVNTILTSTLIFELAVIIYLGLYALIRCQSKKRTFFILFTFTFFLYILGYLLEITSSSIDGAFNGIKILYLGAAFISPCFLLLVLDFCDIKLKKRYISLLMVIPVVTIALVWTSEPNYYHYYTSITFSSSWSLYQATNSSEAWYYIYRIYTMINFFAACCVSVAYYFKPRLNPSLRKQAVLLGCAGLIPLISLSIYNLDVKIYDVYYPAVSLLFSLIILFFNLMRYNIFDITSKASELALDSMTEAFLLIDSEQCFLSANNATKKIFPQLGEIRKGQPMDGIEAWPEELGNLDATDDENRSVEFMLRQENQKSYYHANISKISSSGEHVLGWAILVRDITDTKNLMSQFEKIAYTDILTGLLNRGKFMELSARELARTAQSQEEEPVSIIIIDLDNFKKINDTYDYTVGDAILKLVGDSIKNILGTYELFARYGGKQFILLVNLNSNEAVKFATRIKNEIAYTIYEHKGNIIKCTISLGVASRSIDAPTIDKMIQYADEALSRARINGYNRVECYK